MRAGCHRAQHVAMAWPWPVALARAPRPVTTPQRARGALPLQSPPTMPPATPPPLPAPAPAAAPDHARVFRALSARLVARRAASFGVRLWLVIFVLALCVGAFTYWRTRVPLDGISHHAGTGTAVERLALVLAACVLAGGVLAASRQVALAAHPPGPEWLALPLAPAHA